MDREQFWSLIDAALVGIAADARGRTGKVLAALERELGQLLPDAVIGFGQQLGCRLAEAYTADLWGAAYVLGGGCSDDGFEYFRAWLVLQGRTVFERSVRVPDSLAEYTFSGKAEAEDLLHLPATVYNELTGELDYTDRVEPPDGELTGELWSDDAQLTKLLPQLAAKYKFAD